MKDLLPLKEAIYEVGLLFSKSTQPSEQQVNAYARALSNYTPQQITYAFNQVILNGSAFFPSLAEILGHLKPKQASSEDLGNLVANEVIQKVIDFGIYRIQEAFDSMSEVSRQTIGENRYLMIEIANSDRDQLPTIRAQIRGMVKAANEDRKNSEKNERLRKLGIETGHVLEMKKPELRKIDYANLLPGDLA